MLRPLRDAASYAAEMLATFPKSTLANIWPRDLSGNWGRLLTALGGEPERIDIAARKLLDELDPRDTVDMLPDWNFTYGLPDPCLAAPASLAEQRKRLVDLATMKGSTSKTFLIQLVQNIGYDIFIETFAPSRMGMARCGEPMRRHGFAWAMKVHAPPVAVKRMHMGSSFMGDRLRAFGNDSLECVMRRHVRATTLPNLVFAYDDPQDTFGDAAVWDQPGPASGADTALPARPNGATYFLVGALAAEAFGGSDAAFAMIASSTRISVGAVGGDAPRVTVPIAAPAGQCLVTVVQEDSGGLRHVRVRINGAAVGNMTGAGAGTLAGDMIAFTAGGLDLFGMKLGPLAADELDWLERVLARQFDIPLATWPVDLRQGV
jgi:uncharacterized protein YmfQ (DUF2313 family)